jgi:beta-lactamase class D
VARSGIIRAMKIQWITTLSMATLCLTAACATPAADTGAAAGAHATPDATPDLAHHFGDITGTFVLLDGATSRTVRHNAERARTRFLPASTFKIPNTLIALETGVAAGPDHALAWDSVRAPRQGWWPAVWARDHTLATALPASVVWYYQELARRIGGERMTDYLNRFGYGNRDIGGGIDQFWLTGELRISADEQVDFLRRFHNGELGVSERSARIVRELIVLEEAAEYRLSGKTGWAGLDSDAEDVGWLVGYLERGGDVHFFAMNIVIRSNEDAAARLRITRSILTELGLM